MGAVSVQDIQALRKITGAGILDVRKALNASNGDIEKARQWLRVNGLSNMKLQAKEGGQGVVALADTIKNPTNVAGDSAIDGAKVAVLLELKCDTDFVAKSDQFVLLSTKMAGDVLLGGTEVLSKYEAEIQELQLAVKENISVGRVVRFDVPPENELGTYLHIQTGRGINGVLVEVQGEDRTRTAELAHDLAVHIAFARPEYISTEEVPQEILDAERKTFEEISRREGKPPAVLEKVTDGRIKDWYKEKCLLAQPWVKDEKQTIQQLLGQAKVLRFAQVEVNV
ncbi:MAG: translation elongation factor Ts [Actinobacteria bacterium]|nr:translation elongation factor Ts [Actinomycetota bacterium]MCL6104711.1 translation elongation factor Ts [Actinomycetota bacterium]